MTIITEDNATQPLEWDPAAELEQSLERYHALTRKRGELTAQTMLSLIQGVSKVEFALKDDKYVGMAEAFFVQILTGCGRYLLQLDQHHNQLVLQSLFSPAAQVAPMSNEQNVEALQILNGLSQAADQTADLDDVEFAVEEISK